MKRFWNRNCIIAYIASRTKPIHSRRFREVRIMDTSFVEVLEPGLTSVFISEYDGELSSAGLYEGIGTATLDNGVMYEGGFRNGLMHGDGKVCWSDGTTYTGKLMDGLATGKGTYRWPDGSTYEGMVKKGLRHGLGVFKCSDNQTYDGEWLEGLRHGRGVMSYHEKAASPTVYTGDWSQGMRHGYGKMVYATGNSYEGEWRDDKKHGRGTMMWRKGEDVYCGEWQNDAPHGVGEFIWGETSGGAGGATGKGAPEGSSNKQINNIYRGEWKDGQREGRGTFFYADGSQYAGAWTQNHKNGLGVMIYPDGRVQAGTFTMDRIGAFASYNVMDEKPVPRATEDVNMQFRLLIDDVFMKRYSAAKAPSTSASSGFLKQTQEMERLVLRFTSNLKSTFKKLADAANQRRKSSNISDVLASDPYVASWSKLEQTQAVARVLHKRFHCITMEDMQRFLREIGLLGGRFTSADLFECLRQMKDHHKFVAQSTIASFLLRKSSVSSDAEQDGGGDASLLRMELVDDFLGPVDAQPNHDIDSRQPLREREFVELLIRCISAADLKEHAFLSAIGKQDKKPQSLYNASLEVMSRKIFPSKPSETRTMSEFSAAFYGQLVQSQLSSPECALKIKDLWNRAIILSGGRDTVQLRHILQLLLTLKSVDNGIAESATLAQLALILDRGYQIDVDQPLAEAPTPLEATNLDGTQSDESQNTDAVTPTPKTKIILDMAALTSSVLLQDFEEMWCKVCMSECWVYIPKSMTVAPTDDGETPDQPSEEVKQQDDEQTFESATPLEPPPTFEQILCERLAAWTPAECV